MIFTLFGMISLAFAVCGVLLLAAKALRIRLPKGTIPLAAGSAMLIFAVWNDYSWYARTQAALPSDIIVAQAYPSQSWLQPWTYLAAPVTRFSAVDLATRKRNEAAPELVLTQVHLIRRYYPPARLWQFFDCITGRRADAIASGDRIDSRGVPLDLQWQTLPADDPMLRLACRDEGLEA